jgi:ElaB/YqjD/DUF883 family membrane-anchored ribosome-binding protein
MDTNPKTVDETQETATQFNGSGKSSGFENVKNRIADKLYHIAQTLSEKAADPDTQTDVAACEKHASDWLDHSAKYVRQFDYKQADTKAREYVRRNPGRSILIAGAVGMIIGAILRRRRG